MDASRLAKDTLWVLVAFIMTFGVWVVVGYVFNGFDWPSPALSALAAAITVVSGLVYAHHLRQKQLRDS